MVKICKHGKWFRGRWVSFYNQIDDDLEKCCVCGDIRSNPLPELKNSNIKKIEDIGDEGEQVSGMENDIDLYYALKRLSKRQREVAELILEGYREVEIAEKLSISRRTVRTHKHRIVAILGDLSL